MTRPLMISLHILCAGAWLGCLWAELAFERLLQGHGPETSRWLARLHWRVDRWVEVPAMLGVAITGMNLWPGALSSLWLIGMAILGGLAIAANAVCVEVVRRRWRAAEAGDAAGFEVWDRLQHRLGVLVFLGVHGALVVGLLHAAGAVTA